MRKPLITRLPLRAGLAVGLGAALSVALLTAVGAIPRARPVNVAPLAWETTADGKRAEFLVILEDQADLGAAATFRSREARLRHVYDTLRTTALRSQAGLRAELKAAGVSFRPFYIVNMVAVRGDRDLLIRLADRRDVARIAANPRIRQPLPKPHPEGMRPLAAEGIEWNVKRINADDVWAMGYTGEDIVVAGQDTGYDWDHPALINQYRGYDGVTATHHYNWHDAIHTGGGGCGSDSAVPCDDNGHGTHTMGIIVGDDGAGNQIGVAPGVKWIGCRNMDEGIGTPATYAECFEFFLAPYPVGGDPFFDAEPSLAPHVINNSWTCPSYEGCDWDTLQAVVNTVRAAGIVVVASAGNSGPGCSTVQDPPAVYDAAFSAGATDTSDNIAGFSSRGPVTVDGSGRLKPDVSAPGVGVRSSYSDGTYTGLNGTSMAGPHVAGTVALLWSADPSLIGDVDATEEIIARTARPRTTAQSCGGGGPDDIPNNVYGWGIVDALAAVQAAGSHLQVSKQPVVPKGLAVRSLSYTLTVTNTSPFTLTHVVLTDAIPTSTRFAGASGDHIEEDGTVTWTAASLSPWERLTATLTIATEHLVPGTRVVNADYGVTARELLTPTIGAPVEALIPWRYLLWPVFKNWDPED